MSNGSESPGQPTHAGESSPARFEPVIALADLPEGAPTGVTLSDGTAVCLVRMGMAVHAVHDCCTHQAFMLSAGDLVDDGTLECAWHGARFDLATGSVIRGPACDPLRLFEVHMEDGMVCVARPRAP